MKTNGLPDWEFELVEEAIAAAEARLRAEEERRERADGRALQLAREQAYHRLAVAIDRPARRRRGATGGQLSFFPAEPTLFGDE